MQKQPTRRLAYAIYKLTRLSLLILFSITSVNVLSAKGNIEYQHYFQTPGAFIRNEQGVVLIELDLSESRYKRLYTSKQFDVDSDDGLIGYFNPKARYLYDEARRVFVEYSAEKSGQVSEDMQTRLWQGRFLNWLTTTRADYQILMIAGQRASHAKLIKPIGSPYKYILFDGNSRHYSPIPNGRQITLQAGVLRFGNKKRLLQILHPKSDKRTSHDQQGLMNQLRKGDVLYVYGNQAGDKGKQSRFAHGEDVFSLFRPLKRTTTKPLSSIEKQQFRLHSLQSALDKIAVLSKKANSKSEQSDASIICQRYVHVSFVSETSLSSSFPPETIKSDCQTSISGQQALVSISLSYEDHWMNDSKDVFVFSDIGAFRHTLFSKLDEGRIASFPQLVSLSHQNVSNGSGLVYQNKVRQVSSSDGRFWEGQLSAVWLDLKTTQSSDNGNGQPTSEDEVSNRILWNTPWTDVLGEGTHPSYLQTPIRTHLENTELSLQTLLTHKDEFIDELVGGLLDEELLEFLQGIEGRAGPFSTPVIVDKPASQFVSMPFAKSYSVFKVRHKNRRTRVFVQSHDGMIHAFNGGWFDQQEERILSGPHSDSTWQLGEKMWSFLPHGYFSLQRQRYQRSRQPEDSAWLPWQHVNVSEQPLYVFDAQVFGDQGLQGQKGAEKNLHPEGWGTLLLVGVGITTPEYLLFDITDAEQAPALVGRIQAPQLRRANSLPTAITLKNDQGEFGWYLAIGSGHDSSFDKDQIQHAAGLLLVNIQQIDASSSKPLFIPLASEFDQLSGVSAADWNQDGVSDALYLNANNSHQSTGAILKINTHETISEWQSEALLELSQTVLGRPQLSVDSAQQPWLYIHVNHTLDRNGPNKLLGFKAILTKALSESELLDVTSIEVDKMTGALSGQWALSPELEEKTVQHLHKRMLTPPDSPSFVAGWRKDLNKEEILLGESLLYGGILVQNIESKREQSCQVETMGRVLQLKFTTGTPWYRESLKTTDLSNEATLNTDTTLRADQVSEFGLLHFDGSQMKLVNADQEGLIQQIVDDFFEEIKTGVLTWREL